MSVENLPEGEKITEHKDHPHRAGGGITSADSEIAEDIAASEMSPSRIFILRPVATTLLMVAVLLAGFVGYRLLPQSALPEVDYPTIQVTTLYPGASPDVTTSSITSPRFEIATGCGRARSTGSDQRGNDLFADRSTLATHLRKG